MNRTEMTAIPTITPTLKEVERSLEDTSCDDVDVGTDIFEIMVKVPMGNPFSIRMALSVAWFN